MVDSRKTGNETYGFIRAFGEIYPVKKGSYVGRNSGVVTDIGESEIHLKEFVKMDGRWIEQDRVIRRTAPVTSWKNNPSLIH
jgi:Tfp pilus assembly protein PilP